MPSTEKSTWTFEDQSRGDILQHTVSNYPHDSSREKPSHIVEARPAKNVTPENPARRYLVDPLEFLEVDKWAEQRGLDICGFYHSHPDHPCAPSEYDRKTAWEGYLYLIVAVKGGEFDEAKAWTFDGKEESFKEVILQWQTDEEPP
jgi:proteasome lid subunit RPN8/RPN11